ncbi:MAG: hypothetical protein JWQ59_1518 [Cryobacterium sp.]|nr:hypothetical protein [Cryobacterium sp.]
MLVLLPPSETKRDGGLGDPLNYGALGFPKLNARRRPLVRALRALARDPEATTAALGLGRTQLSEIGRNRTVTVSPTMPAIDRYTGVLYDALDAASLGQQARESAGSHVVVHSALFGLIGALDLIPAYRMSHDSRLPGITLRKHWSDAISAALGTVSGPILDLRSEAYVALGPVPAAAESVFLRVVTEGADGQKRALNHFNKKSKGEFTRALVQRSQPVETIAELLDWAEESGFRLHHGAPGELELVVDQVVAVRA